MYSYKDILVAENCYLKYHSAVGLFITSDCTLLLIGEAKLYKLRNKIFADIYSEIEINDFYPQIKFMGNFIDSLILKKDQSAQIKIKSIQDQISNRKK